MGVKCDELKAHNINDLSLQDIANCDFYIKSEADKGIAELKDKLTDCMRIVGYATTLENKIAELQDKDQQKDFFWDGCGLSKRGFKNTIAVVEYIKKLEKELRHDKRKRCLAMAERCKDNIEDGVQYNEHDDWLIINEYWERWLKRWLKLAEKLKEGV